MHSKSLAFSNQAYCGLALIKVVDVKSTSEALNMTYDSGAFAVVDVICSPLDKNGTMRIEQVIYTDDDGLPMHADIKYNFTPIEGESIPTAVRKIARALAKQPPARFFPDPDIDSAGWNGEILAL